MSPPLPFHRTAPCLALAAVLLLAPGCRRESKVSRATKEKVLLLGNGAEPKSLDPQLVTSVGDSNIMRALFEGLVTFHPSEDAVAEPGVAERWEANEDFTEWTFHLRPDARWSNGDPVTAEDFAYAYQRILEPDFASPYASMLTNFLAGAEAFNKGDSEDFSSVGVEALDERTLRLRLVGPTDYFPEILKHTTWLPVHRPTVEKFGAMTDRFTNWQRPGNHVGNGAFQLDDWRINDAVEVVPNPHYWDAETVELEKIVFKPASPYTEERAFRDGQLHYTYTLPSSLIEWYRENRPEVLRTEPYAGIYFYRCNVEEPPLDDPRVRKALALSIDRRSLVENVTLGGQTPAHGYTPPFEGVYDSPDRVGFDPERARALLAEAGYPGGEGFPGFEILINTSEDHRSIAEAIQAMWKEHLGISGVEINNQEWKVFQQTLHAIKYEMARSGWIGDYVHPTTFLTMWRTGDTNNETHWSNENYDRLIAESLQATDPEERLAKLHAAEEILLEEMPVIPLYWYTRVYLLRPEVKNWNPMVLDNRPWKHIRLEDLK